MDMKEENPLLLYDDGLKQPEATPTLPRSQKAVLQRRGTLCHAVHTIAPPRVSLSLFFDSGKVHGYSSESNSRVGTESIFLFERERRSQTPFFMHDQQSDPLFRQAKMNTKKRTLGHVKMEMHW